MENNLVVKSNDLIEARYDLSLMEQKIIIYAVSNIDSTKEGFKKVYIEVKKITELIDSTVKRYTEFREIANKLMDRKVCLTDRPNLDVRWLASSEYIGNGIIELEFSEKLIPYLLQLKAKFTRYELKNILYLKNKYGIRIYELLKQYENIGGRKFDLTELKNILMIEENKYIRIYDFERFVLKPSIKEINFHTDLNISYEKLKRGKKIVGVKFNIKSKGNDSYIKCLDQIYDIKEFRLKSGLEKENFNSQQIIELYEIAVNMLIDDYEDETDIFEYIRLNYLFMLDKQGVKNKFSYLKKALREDYAVARGQIKLNYKV